MADIKSRWRREWVAINPVLRRGELVHERDSNRFKIGDGRTSWTDLLYLTLGSNDSSKTKAPFSKWLAIGDSLTEGQSATSIENRWVNKTLTKIREEVGVSGGIGYVPAYYAMSNFVQPFTFPDGVASQNDWSHDLGRRSVTLGANQRAVGTVVGTSVDVWYLTNGFDLEVLVDGVLVDTINTRGEYHGGNVHRVALGASGSHEISLVARGGNCYFSGVMVYDGDEEDGIRLWTDSRSGQTSNQAAYLTPQDEKLRIIKAIDPDFVSIFLGLNDLGASTPSAETAGNLHALTTIVREAAPLARIMWIAPYAPHWGGTGAAAFAPYVTEMRYWLSQHRAVECMDLRDLIGVAGTSGLWNADGLHPTDTGHERISTHFNALVLRGD